MVVLFVLASQLVGALDARLPLRAEAMIFVSANKSDLVDMGS